MRYYQLNWFLVNDFLINKHKWFSYYIPNNRVTRFFGALMAAGETSITTSAPGKLHKLKNRWQQKSYYSTENHKNKRQGN